MPIEFACRQCGQKMRVADTGAGKSVKCPGCATVAQVPTSSAAAAPAPQPPGGNFSFQPSAPQPTMPQPSGPNPYAEMHKAAGPVNPYASPANIHEHTPTVPGGVGNQVVGFGDIWNHAFSVWQNNLGLMIGVIVIMIGMNIVIGLASQFAAVPLMAAGQPLGAIVVRVVVQLAGNIFQIFLGIGQAQIALKLCRRQPAQLGDLFNGGAMVLPVIGYALIAGLVIGVSAVLIIVGGAFISRAVGQPLLIFFFLAVVAIGLLVLAFLYWPGYFTIVDGKAGPLDAFGIASNITANNHPTTFLVGLTGVGVMFLGFLACIIGALFAAPLWSLLWATAYLMMSGQIPLRPIYAGSPYGAGGYPQQPMGPPGMPGQFPAPGWQPPRQ